MDQLDLMMRWEADELTDKETDTLFQSLVDSGLAWKLQGCYGRMAMALYRLGRIKIPGQPELTKN